MNVTVTDQLPGPNDFNIPNSNIISPNIPGRTPHNHVKS